MLPASMPYFFLNSSEIGMLLPSGSPTSLASDASLPRTSSAAIRMAFPIWNSEREPSVPMS